ncbi:aldo/keto reductase [Pseudoxanthomonas sp. CAU 1598]|uniref:Aldo/keto reductase n=2 Tax=Pseudomarimonas arenosa TaxID=2774145 RepID=A0AAW3ZIP5_9GAMM|nr:aldo/keto reductase [Pseudomarimonas arenosa]
MRAANGPTRRTLLQAALALSLASGVTERAWADTLIQRPIPSSGELLPLIGLGSWITFNVGDDAELRAECAAVIEAFFAEGGRLIDSSPMYGSSQSVIGAALQSMGRPDQVFSADKVWISDPAEGRSQIEQSRRHWAVTRFDLMQVHNLLSWEAHLDTLLQMKADGKLRYVGITTSEGRRHEEFERVMRRQPLDFIQLSYNLVNRQAEQRLLPLAQERGIAVIANRPFQQGVLIDRLKRHPLPPWAGEWQCNAWSQLLLKFIVSHPALTCAIPATSQVAHLRENMQAARGVLPDESQRKQLVEYVDAL